MLRIPTVFAVFWGLGLIAMAEPPAKPPATPIQIGDTLPFGQKPIDYLGSESHTAIEELQKKLDAGNVTFSADTPEGYLRSVLQSLDISADSQMLVFSKTALNPKLVSPKTPRAVYFNEETYVAWVPGAAAVEIAAVDPQKGWMFYTLKLPESSAEAKVPRFERENQCLACHAGRSSLHVPGGLVRGFVTDEAGNPLSGYSRITHETPFENRFGGWFVTGTSGLTHRGNRIVSQTASPLVPDPESIKDLSDVLDASRYLSAHSDLVAQLLLHHQIHGQNLLIRLGHEARLGKRSDAEDLLVRYLLFAEEAPLPKPVSGSTEFAPWFAKRGRKDSLGRSLREWDLKTRLFKYRLSYLIDTPLFDGLPAEVKQRTYRSLWDILAAKAPAPPFDHIPEAERRAILEIVRELKTDLPPIWAKGNTR